MVDLRSLSFCVLFIKKDLYNKIIFTTLLIACNFDYLIPFYFLFKFPIYSQFIRPFYFCISLY